MELAQIIKTLWDQRIAVVAVLVVAFLGGLSTVYRVGTGGLSTRSHQFGAAQSQILIDSPRSSLVDLTQDTPPLATRAAVYTQFMRSNAVKEAISQATGIPANLIVAQGPYTTAGGTQNLPRPSEARANEVRGEKAGYRLVFDYQQDLPIVSIYAQAPSAKAAISLAAGTVAGVRAYISRLEREQNVPAHAQTQIRELGSAEGGTVNSGADPIMAILAFIGIAIAGLGGILALNALTRGFQKLSQSARTRPEPNAATVSTAPEPSLETLPTVAEPRRRHAGRAV
ncbi:MAG: hypothetical protein QOC68_2065 [Solirubrobacteraceae bacterium]|nr:hypothetical protein [Solirubrobacteraceae bacterium]